MQDLRVLDDAHAKAARKEVYRVTIILSILTVVELALGFSMVNMSEQSFSRHLIKGIILILMLAKAFYIVAYFMHLKHELRNMIMTIVLPLGLFVWFIIAFLADGNSFRELRNKYAPYDQESNIPVKQNQHSEQEKGTIELKKAVE
ncbi:cytochrome C oxidase subunit IV family protein [Hydrotalea sp.]|uniref:cytochrome C oxidase subunit IV family protein n=1 Tax=Hydrotalea sp. TaxID=2881279 RepID=UPI003D0EAE50